MNTTECGTGIEVDVDPPIPFVLHAGKDQLVVERSIGILILPICRRLCTEARLLQRGGVRQDSITERLLEEQPDTGGIESR